MLSLNNKSGMKDKKTIKFASNEKEDKDDDLVEKALKKAEEKPITRNSLIYNVESEKLRYEIPSKTSGVPFSYIKWRPTTGVCKTKNVFVTTNADGEIQHWHLTSKKCIDTIKNKSDFDVQLNCIDFTHDVSKFIVCGSDPILKLYDEEKKVCIREFSGEGSNTPGHSNRVYCVKFAKENPNILLSGGWDKRVILWDANTGNPINSFFGPSICGDGIDTLESIILTSSWSSTNQLQEWDMTACKLLRNIPWDSTPSANLKTSTDPVFLYCGQFSKDDGTFILTGGSNSNEARLFDYQDNSKPFCAIYDLPREVDTVDFSHKGNMFLVSGGDSLIRVFSMNYTS